MLNRLFFCTNDLKESSALNLFIKVKQMPNLGMKMHQANSDQIYQKK